MRRRATIQGDDRWAAGWFAAPGWLGGLARGVAIGLALLAAVELHGAARDEGGAVRAAATAPIEPGAIRHYPAWEYPKLYERLGEIAFARANRRTGEAAGVAARAAGCDAVIAAGVARRSTADALAWEVDCRNGRRIVVREVNGALVTDGDDREGDDRP